MRTLRLLVVLLGATLLALQFGPRPPPKESPEPTSTSARDTSVTDASSPDQAVGATSTTSVTTTTTTTAPEPCRVRDPGPPPPDLTPAEVALHLSRRGHTCSDHVTISINEPEALKLAARLALDRGGPLLVESDEVDADALTDEVVRLQPSWVTAVGAVTIPDSALPSRVSRPGLGTPFEPVTGEDRDSPTVWLITGGDPATTLPPAIMGHALKDTVRLTGGRDLRALPPAVAEDVRTAAELRTIGVETERRRWELAVLRRGLELPGGGQRLFPEWRIVAAYGTPGTGALGVLGETGPEEAASRISEFAAGYDADGIAVMPAFEIIATIASAGPGDDGDYSDEVSPDTIRPWIEYAAANDIYVVLDLQPGRTDFLTQAQRYEGFLLLPNVGLALDPEWRLEPDQRHLRQIGSVEAAEVNRVARWLADLTRAHLLPQKLLLIHQFKLSMIENRQDLVTPPELAVVVQMDGQGPLGTKYDTFDALIQGTEGVGWRWGWKNFFDEDDPTARPDQVLSVEPTPVFVSFQ